MRTCSKCGCLESNTILFPKTKNVCKKCKAEYRHQYYLRHAEHIKSVQKSYYESTKPIYVARKAKWYIENREERRRRNKIDFQINRQKYYQYKYARNRKMGKPDQDTLRAIPLIRMMPCGYCGSEGGTVDHILPVSRGGINHWTNMFPACSKCNDSKGKRTPEEWVNRWYL
jgi:5-methylcytosine-specific restriction endonuclease McrA